MKLRVEKSYSFHGVLFIAPEEFYTSPALVRDFRKTNSAASLFIRDCAELMQWLREVVQ